MLSSLRLLDFRCFEAIDLEVPAGGAILTGDNAQGKTSVLEAICVLVRLHSPRTNRLANLTRFGSAGFGVAGSPWGSDRQVRQATGGALQFKVDGELRAKNSDYLADGGLVVWMGNEDLALVRGPGEGRRLYLDFIGAQLDPTYHRAWGRYRRALRAKNLLLKEGRGRETEIHSYEQIMIECGSLLMDHRHKLVETLAPLAAEAQITVSGKEERLTLDYLPASGPDLAESMHQAREREVRTRQAVVGPHRDDISLRLGGMPAAEFASEGQQRTLAIALKLAQGRLLAQRGGREPIYLMDDIFGELDPGRRNALMGHLPECAQKWITTTNMDWLRETGELAALARFKVSAGVVKAES